MRINPSLTELTTAATDAVLGVVCLVLLLRLVRRPDGPAWKRAIWGAVFACLATASFLGAIAHGGDWAANVRARLWQPLYLSLGLTVALFLVGAIGDWRGRNAVRRVLPWMMIVAVAFFAITQWGSGSFLLFVAYEGVVMFSTLAIYLHLRARGRTGAGTVAAGITLSIAAAGVQASSLGLTVVVPFDHNGLFHLVQIVGVVVTARGVRAGLVADGVGR
jgi:hypothetical protein